MLFVLLSHEFFCWMNALTARYFPAFVCFPWCRAVLARSSCTMPRSACTITSNLQVSPVAHLDTKTRAQVCIYAVLSTFSITS
ncbi:hypothetical protein BJ741DRAFT_641000 [Chytriomyces cf. hyalinus JEL632]|nr:hypothetical protein BJ741DRAFT_641000 [Chytriomyces cf. hyalinus JEL632]